MRILLDGLEFDSAPTGVAKATLGLYRACMDINPDLQVLTLHRETLKCSLHEQMRSRRLAGRLSKRWWRRLVLPKYVLGWRPHFIHFPNGFIPGIISSMSVPVVTTLYDVGGLYYNGEKEKWKFARRVQWELDNADMVITASEYSKKDIVNNFRVNREPTVIYLAPYLHTNDEAPDLDPAAFGDYFIYAGGYQVHRKGIEDLVKVFMGLHREKKLRSKLLLVGSKRSLGENFDRLVDDGISIGAIKELGYISDASLAALYKGARALVYPSRCEGFGLPPLEAMSLGCPVITTRAMSIPEVCGDAVCYIDPDNEWDFCEAIVALENDSNLRNELKAKGIKRASHFSWQDSARKFLEETARL